MPHATRLPPNTNARNRVNAWTGERPFPGGQNAEPSERV
jgi:hypothetical protein